jgi:hypothetical protein
MRKSDGAALAPAKRHVAALISVQVPMRGVFGAEARRDNRYGPAACFRLSRLHEPELGALTVVIRGSHSVPVAPPLLLLRTLGAGRRE